MPKLSLPIGNLIVFDVLRQWCVADPRKGVHIPLMQWNVDQRNFKSSTNVKEKRQLAKLYAERKIVCITFLHFFLVDKGDKQEYQSMLGFPLKAPRKFSTAIKKSQEYYSSKKLKTRYASDEAVKALGRRGLQDKNVTSALEL